MSRIIAFSALGLLGLAGALLEGMMEQAPPQVIQFNGILIILCTGVFVFSALKILFADK